MGGFSRSDPGSCSPTVAVPGPSGWHGRVVSLTPLLFLRPGQALAAPLPSRCIAQGPCGDNWALPSLISELIKSVSLLFAAQNDQGCWGEILTAQSSAP